MAKRKRKKLMQVEMDDPKMVERFRIATVVAHTTMKDEITAFVAWYLHDTDAAPKRPAKK